jgi:hypothetical protein
LAALNCWYAALCRSLPLTGFHMAYCIHWCRGDRSVTSVDCLYPSKGRFGNWSLAFAFEIHYIASTREKHQEIKDTYAGLSALLKTFSLIWAFTSVLWNCTEFISLIMGNPVDISMYFVSRRQHACKVQRPNSTLQ